MNSRNIVLDASAAIAYLNQETGAEIVEQALSKAYISTVNLSEIISYLAFNGVSEPEIEEIIEDLQLSIIPFDRPQSLLTGFLRPKTKFLGLSLGDRACLSLGIIKKFPVLTADRAWLQLGLGIVIQPIR